VTEMVVMSVVINKYP